MSYSLLSHTSALEEARGQCRTKTMCVLPGSMQTILFMQTGTIARIVADRGFGFITQPGNDKDLFFHAKELDGVEFESLKEGDVMEFDVENGPKGPSAINVRPSSAAPSTDDATEAPAEESAE